ncbi:glycoside hydrolase family 97 protein [Brevundimonas sp. AJA228-03]|uniref:glycoside hydrolase family 97 protein n=1 Tax=Brevundimonas sp. AJA228-03 TaxID=2752515 RepID=UPI001ADF7E05|nr:glycoside hydrolase family 97 protein [Brevundimonas sp. AJA228-03]QTN20471.1 glycoside hydrolase family 97 protein [Brevundimonas sp. AJA228-03]
MRFPFVVLAIMALCTPALAQTPPPAPATVSSPDGTLSVSVTTDGDGRPSYAVTRSGQPVIAPSRLGFILTDAPKLERNLVVTAEVPTDHDDTWEQPWGERRFIRNHYRELRVHLRERTALARSFDVVFRVYDDGLGFRYEFPEQAALPVLNIGSELTEFNIAEDGEAWWIPSREWNREEYLYHRTPIEEASGTQTPLTMKLNSGLHISIHEAALVDYAGMNLRRAEGRRFVADLTPGFTNAAVERTAPFPTPWRTIQISETAGGLVESSLILNLNEPNAIGDVSWFKPMKYVGIWWEMHLDRATWASGPRHGATTENTRRYIDFAAANGFGGVLVEGWNIGWDGDWFGNGSDYSFTQPYPDFDLEGLAAYGRERGVQLIGHHETGGNAFHYEQQMADAFALDQRLGITTVKTGYVADAGGVQVRGPDGQSTFAWNESQAMARHHIAVLEAAAAHHVAINPHEPIKDTGLRRTYPNWVSREGARGMEFNAWGQPGNPPEHEVNLVFTRLLAGPMDFTPGIFGMVTRSPDGVATTWAKQLALYVTIYSPIQMAADLPENYEANPGPFQFIKDVAVDWDETRVLNGEVGDYVTIVRKERGGREWFLGSITDENPRVLSAALTFLEPGVRYRAEIYRDGPHASWRDGGGMSRTDIVIEQQEVTAGDILTLRLAPGGGQAIRFVPLGRGARQ